MKLHRKISFLLIYIFKHSRFFLVCWQKCVRRYIYIAAVPRRTLTLEFQNENKKEETASTMWRAVSYFRRLTIDAAVCFAGAVTASEHESTAAFRKIAAFLVRFVCSVRHPFRPDTCAT